MLSVLWYALAAAPAVGTMALPQATATRKGALDQRGGARHYVERTIGREDPDPPPIARILMLTKKVSESHSAPLRDHHK